jgi:hypothetical protein
MAAPVARQAEAIGTKGAIDRYPRLVLRARAVARDRCPRFPKTRTVAWA